MDKRCVAKRALDIQPRRRKFRGSLCPDQEGHVSASLQQAAAKVAAGCARTNDQNSHFHGFGFIAGSVYWAVRGQFTYFRIVHVDFTMRN
jgi:hypothetical protein